MTETITEVGLLPSNLTEDRGIVNTFNGQVATIEQQHDLLTFRAVGEEATETYITHQILGSHSLPQQPLDEKNY